MCYVRGFRLSLHCEYVLIILKKKNIDEVILDWVLVMLAEKEHIKTNLPNVFTKILDIWTNQ